MDTYLTDLIERMASKDVIVPGKVFHSKDSISWKAHREAEALEDGEYVSRVMDLITREKKKPKRRCAYFILGKLLAKIPNPSALQFFIDRLDVETDKYTACAILGLLDHIPLPESVDIGPILSCTFSDKWQIRHDAISALTKAEHPSAKQRIREILLQGKEDFKKYKFELVYANVVLGELGTTDDIELLREVAKSRLHDVRGSALYAIETIQSRK